MKIDPHIRKGLLVLPVGQEPTKAQLKRANREQDELDKEAMSKVFDEPEPEMSGYAYYCRHPMLGWWCNEMSKEGLEKLLTK